jgi:outer membrane lipoprotein LolB
LLLFLLVRSPLRVRLTWLTAATLLALTGCATVSTTPGEAPWTSGRLSVRVAASAERSAQSVSANFELRAQGDSGELRLSSPLGTRMATAIWAPGVARLMTTEGEANFGTLDDLSRQSMGENLPLAALPDWLAGRPWPGAPHRNTDAGFDQLDWQISLARQREGWIEARRSTPPEVLVRVRLDGPP